MKCFKPHYLGDFALNGPFLRRQGTSFLKLEQINNFLNVSSFFHRYIFLILIGLNRLGNLIVPSENYTGFEV